MVTILIRWLIFLHILAALTFFLAHGTSAAMASKFARKPTLLGSAPCLTFPGQP